MSELKSRVLGLDLGTRQIGFALFEGERLIHYGIKTIRKSGSQETFKTLRTVLNTLTVRNSITVIAFETVSSIQQQRSLVKAVQCEVLRYATKYNIRAVEYNPKILRQAICLPQKPKKLLTHERLAQRYAEILPYLKPRNYWQQRYVSHLFDAIAVGLYCVWDIKKSCSVDEKKIHKKLSPKNKLRKLQDRKQ